MTKLDQNCIRHVKVNTKNEKFKKKKNTDVKQSRTSYQQYYLFTTFFVVLRFNRGLACYFYNCLLSVYFT